jgi:hypothetical protein
LLHSHALPECEGRIGHPPLLTLQSQCRSACAGTITNYAHNTIRKGKLQQQLESDSGGPQYGLNRRL